MIRGSVNKTAKIAVAKTSSPSTLRTIGVTLSKLVLVGTLLAAPVAVLAEEHAAPAAPAASAPAAAAPAAPAVAAPAAAVSQPAAAPAAAPAEAPKPKNVDPVLNTGDTAWMLVSAAMVLLMTPGLAFFYGGMVRSKNVLSTMMHSFVAMGIVGVQWAVFGYSLAFGPDLGGHGLVGDLSKLMMNGLITFKDGNPVFALFQNVPTEPGSIPEYVFALYQMMFAIITVALISGTLAERIKFSTWCVFVLLWTTLVYDPLAHWVWMVDGWLFKMGALDFAGGTVVHLSSGISALAALLFLGKRHGFPTERMMPHNLPFTLLGVGLLWFGWFGFNAGSAIVGVNCSDAAGGLAGLAFATTTIAPAAAGLSWMIAEWIHGGKPSALGFGSGVVAGLVIITPAAGFVQPGAALIMGLLGGVICYGGVLMKAKFKYDDSLDVLGVHALGGSTGALLTGVFATVGATGLMSGNMKQFVTQLIAVGAAGAYAFIVTLVIAFVLQKVMGFRVDKEDEIVGLDQTQHSETAYN